MIMALEHKSETIKRCQTEYGIIWPSEFGNTSAAKFSCWPFIMLIVKRPPPRFKESEEFFQKHFSVGTKVMKDVTIVRSFFKLEQETYGKAKGSGSCWWGWRKSRNCYALIWICKFNSDILKNKLWDNDFNEEYLGTRDALMCFSLSNDSRWSQDNLLDQCSVKNVYQIELDPMYILKLSITLVPAFLSKVYDAIERAKVLEKQKYAKRSE